MQNEYNCSVSIKAGDCCAQCVNIMSNVIRTNDALDEDSVVNALQRLL
jgi:hypothetical protein